MRRILVGILAVVILAIVVGCGTETTSTQPVKPADTKASPSKAVVGDTLSIAGNEAKLEVTLLKTKRGPAVKAYGTQMSPAAFAVMLRIKNTGTKVYDDSVSNCAVLVDVKDQTHNAEFSMMDKSGNLIAGMLESVKISSGDQRSGWVFFAMKPSQKPRTLQYTAESGFGPEVGEWSLK
jgi:uncharacterized lipoprotein YajG